MPRARDDVLIWTLVSCTFISDADIAEKLGSPARAGPADTGVGSDSADTAEPPDTGAAAEADCDAPGTLASGFDGYVWGGLAAGEHYRSTWPLTGEGAVCAAVCTEPWAFAFLGVEADGWADDLSPNDWPLPQTVSGGGGLALFVDLDIPTGVTAGGTCTVEVSGAEWTFTWEMWAE